MTRTGSCQIAVCLRWQCPGEADKIKYMPFAIEPYVGQESLWPRRGKHILAQFDVDTIVVYQAYRPSIARYAVEARRFGRDFSYSRMSWIKPNFLWMMYRSGWGTKEGQEVTRALRLRRQFFDGLLLEGVASSFEQSHFATLGEWKAAVANSAVRVQWDPDHDPLGNPIARRAIQIGLRGQALHAYGQHELLEVIDLTDFVVEERERLLSRGPGQLRMPKERIYVPDDRAIGQRLRLDGPPPQSVSAGGAS
jgi:hypothetical protein